MFSIILQRNNKAKQEADDGYRVLSWFTECQSNLSSTFPKTVTIFFCLSRRASRPQTILAVSATAVSDLSLKVPRCRCQSARHPPLMLHSKHSHSCCFCCTYLHPTTARASCPFYIPGCWKAITCYSRTEMAITLGAHSSNKRVSHLLPQNLCFPCCLHSKLSIWFNDQGELITSPSKQFHCARNKINYHPSYILIQKFLTTLSSWSSLFFCSHALPCLHFLSFQFICSKPTTLFLGIPWYLIMENLEIKLV